jgi:hypothetical protein
MMLVFPQNGGSASIVLSSQSPQRVVLRGPRGGTRVLTVTVVEIGDDDVNLTFDFGAETPADPSEASGAHSRPEWEGKTDRAIDKFKRIAEKAIDKVKQAVKKVRD